MHYGGTPGSGETDTFNPYGARAQRSFPAIYKADAPAALVVEDDGTLRLTLSLYREGMNAGSPFYGCLAFRNVLDAVYGVEHETRSRVSTPEAAARDAFIDATAATYAGWYSMPTPTRGWADYYREEVRNALAHVWRTGRRHVNADDPAERVRLSSDARVLQHIAKGAVEQRWPHGVTAVRRDDC